MINYFLKIGKFKNVLKRDPSFLALDWHLSRILNFESSFVISEFDSIS